MSKLAVVLFNLGGPDAPGSVKPFLFNLFNDPAIIGVPNPMRWLLAKLISSRREPAAQEIYAHLGGRSPLLELTREQAAALEARLNSPASGAAGGRGGDVRVFVAMRHWHPFAAETVNEVLAFAPDRVILLPLYPQFSTTTSASSLADWRRVAEAAGLRAPATAVCCYPLEAGLVEAQARRVAAGLEKASALGRPRVLFSAHGLPEKVIAGGDPYRWQVERTAEAVARRLNLALDQWVVCFQSRVGPLKWIGPSTDAEIQRAGADKVVPVVVPIAFVSEHSETLVEIEIEYRELAEKSGAPGFVRVEAVGTQDDFIGGLALVVREQAAMRTAGGKDHAIFSGCGSGARLCPRAFGRCPNPDGTGP